MKITRLGDTAIKKRLVKSDKLMKLTRVGFLITLAMGFFFMEFLILAILLSILIATNQLHMHLEKIRLEIRAESRELARFMLGTQTQVYGGNYNGRKKRN